MEGRKGVTVKKEEVLLTAKGVIGPGYKVDLKSPMPFTFFSIKPPDPDEPSWLKR